MNDHPSSANIENISFSTGHRIFQSLILPAIEKAQFEVILVTCFWANPSPTLSSLNDSLLRLSNSARGKQNVKVRIGFSSSSLWQKVFHPQGEAGRVWRSEEWSAKLGLPSEEQMGGLEVQVRSKFFLPFSVWHSKFVIVDRRRVFLPSCNVSWEEWFEGCVEVSGKVVGEFVGFWERYWGDRVEERLNRTTNSSGLLDGMERCRDERHVLDATLVKDVPCKFLPSPHNRNPRFRFPWQPRAPPPRSPLNHELLNLFENAQKEIFIQTPNITSPPVLDAIRAALTRGVSVEILTSERLMILEQLVTAFTTTSRCVKHVIKFHQRSLARHGDEEAGLLRPGRLQVGYYVPLSTSRSGLTGNAEPVQSHLKLTAVDGNAIVFGSGNLDRASWYTSQELGVAFFSEAMIAKTFHDLRIAMTGRQRVMYDSNGQ